MKIVVGFILAFVSAMLFLPRSDSTQIRNLPLLITIVCFFLLLHIIRAFKYIILMIKAKNIIEKNGYIWDGFRVVPFSLIMRFRRKREVLSVAFVVIKKKYQRCHFKDSEHIEFYRSYRIIFGSTKTKGTIVSNLVETELVGRRWIKWGQSAEPSYRKCILLFNRLPEHITDSTHRPGLGNGDAVCSSDIVLYDMKGFKQIHKL